MRSYLIDELSAEELQCCQERLNLKGYASGIENLFWLPVPAQLLTPMQKTHEPDCGPYALALEIQNDALRLELLVRARGTLHCDCIEYASLELSAYMARKLTALLQPAALN